MSYGTFDPATAKQEADLALEMARRICDLANEKQCDVSMNGISARPVHQSMPINMDPTKDMLMLFKVLGKLRKAAAAFMDNLPDE